MQLVYAAHKHFYALQNNLTQYRADIDAHRLVVPQSTDSHCTEGFVSLNPVDMKLILHI